MRILRACAAAVFLLALSGATGLPILVGVARACAMCSSRCCCRPADGGRVCRLARPCAGS